VLSNTSWAPDEAVVGTGTVAAISHPELGGVREVDVLSGLDYAICFLDRTTLPRQTAHRKRSRRPAPAGL